MSFKVPPRGFGTAETIDLDLSGNSSNLPFTTNRGSSRSQSGIVVRE